jgi:hypothetical protein
VRHTDTDTTGIVEEGQGELKQEGILISIEKDAACWMLFSQHCISHLSVLLIDNYYKRTWLLGSCLLRQIK